MGDRDGTATLWELRNGSAVKAVKAGKKAGCWGGKPSNTGG